MENSSPPAHSCNTRCIRKQNRNWQAASLTGESRGDGTLVTLTFEVVAVKASTLTLSEWFSLTVRVSASVQRLKTGKVVVPPQTQGTGVVLESQKIDDTGSGTFGWSKGNSNGVVEVGDKSRSQ